MNGDGKKNIERFLYQVGRKIGEIRSSRGMTQSRFAEKANVSIQTVQYWESGANLGLKTLYRLSQYLRAPMAGFFHPPSTLTAVRGRPRKNISGRK